MLSRYVIQRPRYAAFLEPFLKLIDVHLQRTEEYVLLAPGGIVAQERTVWLTDVNRRWLASCLPPTVVGTEENMAAMQNGS